MEIKYNIIYQEQVIKDHIPALSTKIKLLIKNAIEQKLMVDPLYFGKPLRYSLKGHRRLRVLDYRVVYRIENDSVIVIAIKHRKDIYKK
jgi:addiction module RelE/StbE family toxin